MTKEVEAAEKIVNDLEEQRECLHGRTGHLTDQRKQLAYAANVGDKSARQKLNALNSEVSHHRSDIENVEFALTEARARLAQAKAAEAQAADRANAQQIAELNAKLKDELDNADDAIADAIGSVLSARALLMEMRGRGLASPTDQLFRINAVAAIKTAIQKLPEPWINDFEFSRLAPSQKKQFKPLATAWCDQIANQLAPRLGEQQKQVA
jgi:chromosome segregation ATPase